MCIRDRLLTGASPRYGLYATADGWFLAVGALEPKFWQLFCGAVGLAEPLRDDAHDPQATRAAVAGIIASRDAGHWRSLLEPLDCCCTVVRTLEEARADKHFSERGLFSVAVREPGGRSIPSTPLPLAPLFRRQSETPRRVAASGEDTDELLG